MEVVERAAPVLVRPLETADEMRAGVEVYRRAFALGPSDPAVSPRLLAALRHNAGSVIGAFAGERLVGFVYGFVGLDPAAGALYHYSQMAAVDPGWQGRGVGRALKEGQREHVRSTGVATMRWAYDPLRTHNAHFNLDVLGTVGRWCVPNMYGVEPYGRDAGQTSDRLIVEWAVEGGARPPAPAPPPVAWGEEEADAGDVLLGVPRDWDALVAGDMVRAADVRARVASRLTALMKRGFTAVSCQIAGEAPATAVYRLTRS
jgi:predicted GNAT superfamily acetyltransferase